MRADRFVERQYNKQTRGDVTILVLKGELDALTAPSFKEEIESLLAAHEIKVVLDFAEVRLIDNAGVEAIVELWKRTHSQLGNAKIARLVEQPRAILHLLRLDRKLFEIFDTVDAAVESYGA